MTPDSTLLVDGSSLIYRAYFSTPDTVVTPSRKPINAAYGFLQMLSRLIADRKPVFIAVCTDEDWRPDWRVELVPSYKQHRTEEERTDTQAQADQDISDQLEPIFEILDLSGVAVAGIEGFEAEDVIGALAVKAPGPVEIVSGDRDLFQLVADPNICVLYPKRGVSDMVRVDETYITQKYGIPGRAYGDFALLRGDPSDGLPGVVGIGEKTAAALISKYGDISAVIEAAMVGEPAGPLAKVRSSIDYLDKAARVVLIDPESVGLRPMDISRPTEIDDQKVMEYAGEYGLRTPASRLIAALKDS